MAKNTPALINKTFYWSTARESFKNLDVILDMQEKGLEIQETSAGIKVALPYDFLPTELIEPYNSLREGFGLTIKTVAAIQYDSNNILKYFTSPLVGVHDNKPTLMIGNYSEAIYINFEATADGYKLGKYPAEFVRIPREPLADTCYIKIKGVAGYNHFFPIKLLSGTEPDRAESLFDSGDFSLALSPFGGSFTKATTICQKIIDDGQFPSSGILFVLSSPRINTATGKNGEFRTAVFKIDYCSHPNLNYQDSSPEKKLVDINEIISISFGNKSAPFKAIDTDTKPDRLFVHFVEPYTAGNGAVISDYTPKLFCTSRERLIPKYLLTESKSASPALDQFEQFETVDIEHMIVLGDNESGMVPF